MKTIGLITEYNPYHNGHYYHMEKAKKTAGADFAVVVMSGNFVQRGTPAIADKYTRAHMALSCGADLVLELPVRYACASAEYFAEGAVSLLHNLGIIDNICFGSEEGELSLFLDTAKILVDEPPEYTTYMKKLISEGMTYPAARQEALLAYTENTKLNRFLNEPNNILGIEYCKALLRLKSPIEPLTILRRESGYHQLDLSKKYSSATAIRQILERKDFSGVKDQIPGPAYDILLKELLLRAYLTSDDFSMLLRYKLMLETDQSLSRYLDVTQELTNRIYSKLNQFNSFSQFVAEIKTKDLTYTRVSRSLLHILLNITDFKPGENPAQTVPYARVLGFRKESSGIMREIKEKSTVPLISKLADAENLLDTTALEVLSEDIWCANLYESVLSHKSGSAFRNEMTRGIVIV